MNCDVLVDGVLVAVVVLVVDIIPIILVVAIVVSLFTPCRTYVWSRLIKHVCISHLCVHLSWLS